MSETVLVTNDDGIDAPGLHALARAALATGATVIVAAPMEEASGTSAGLTAAKDHRSVVTERRELPGLPEVTAFAVGAHPGLIALVACHGAFGDRPDLVLSGINRGANVGRAVLHSGTVGAALTASINDVSAVAFSLDTGVGDPVDPRWESAAALVPELIEVLRTGPAGSVFNVNVPDVPADRLKPIRWAALADFGTVQSSVQRLDDGTIELTSVEIEDEIAPDSDAALLAAGHVTVTALRSVAEAGDLHGSDERWR